MILLMIAVGGALGAISRYYLGLLFNSIQILNVSLGTFLVNIIGCICIGICMALIDTKSNFSFLLVIGFLGSFTTMSALSSQTIELMITEKYLIGIIYSVGTVISCVIATFIAYNIFKT